MPSRASSGALHRLSALRHLVRTQRPATETSARNLQRLVTYGAPASPCSLLLLELQTTSEMQMLIQALSQLNVRTCMGNTLT